jgi:O-antigen/teichoic acid export membrane protein
MLDKNNIFVTQNKNNIRFGLVAQVLANAASAIILLMGLFYLEPKTYVDIQLILAYLAFSGFMHLGLVDGIELRISGTSIDRNSYGGIIFLILTLSSMPAILYIAFSNDVDKIILLALIVFPLVNLNALFIVQLKSYGYSWIASKGLMVEKISTILFIILALEFNVSYVSYFVFFFSFPLFFYVWSLFKLGISFNMDFDFYKVVNDLKRGVYMMLSNTAYSLLTIGSIILAKKLFSDSQVSMYAISITMLNFFIGFAAQISNVIYPLMANKFHITGFVKFDTHSMLLGYVVPLLVIFSILSTYVFEYFFGAYFKLDGMLQFCYLILPLVYFEIKNHIVHIPQIKIHLKYKLYLLVNLLTVAGFLITLFFTSFYILAGMSSFVYLLAFFVVLRFLMLSYEFKTLKSIDFFYIVFYIFYMWTLV